MEPSRSKRRRSMQSYIPPLRPDVPARFDSLNDDTLTTVLEFVGDKSYRSFGGTNKHCKEVYLNTPGMTKETFLGYGPLSVITDRYERDGEFDRKLREALFKGVVFYNRRDVLAWALLQRKKDVLRAICNLASKEGRVDILNEVLINVEDEDDKRYVFHDVDWSATQGGKLKVLKWLEDKGVSFRKDWCAGKAVCYGQLHILKWLREERGSGLYGVFYNDAILGGPHLHVMKWLNEQGFPWNDFTFPIAAEEGNLEILQWLHNEGCHWSENPILRVPERELKTEVIDWLLSNGYTNRIVFED